MENEEKVIQMTEAEFQKSMETLVTNTVTKTVEQELDKIDRKYLVHPEMTPEQEAKQLELKQEERFEKLVKYACEKDFAKAKEMNTEIKAADPMTEGTDADGGYLVPSVTAAKILRLIPTYGQARSEVSVMPMGKTDTLIMPKKATGVTVSYTNEKSSITSSKPTLGTITLTAKKLAGLTALSNEIIADANVKIMPYVIDLFAEAFGTEEDNQVFDGTGSPFTGVFNGANTFGKEETVANADSITYAKLTDLIYGIDQKYLNGAKWYMHRTMVAKVRQIVDGNSNPIFVDANAGGLPTLLGYPVKLIEAAPTAAEIAAAGDVMLLLGNLKHSILGDKAALSIKFSDSATVDAESMFQYDLSAVRLIMRHAFNPGLTEAYCALSHT